MKIIINLLAFLLTSNAALASDLARVDSIPEGIESVSVVIPIHSQKVSFKMPMSWNLALQGQRNNMISMEFIPRTESIQSWKNYFSIQGFKDSAGKASPEQFLDIMANGVKEMCGNNLVYEKLGLIDIDGYQAYTAILGCAEFPSSQPFGIEQGQSEVGYYFSINGKNDRYIIHKSIRGKAFNPDESPINKSNAMAFISDFMPIEICRGTGAQGECRK